MSVKMAYNFLKKLTAYILFSFSIKYQKVQSLT